MNVPQDFLKIAKEPTDKLTKNKSNESKNNNDTENDYDGNMRCKDCTVKSSKDLKKSVRNANKEEGPSVSPLSLGVTRLTGVITAIRTARA